MICPCCIIPLFFQLFGIIVKYEIYIFILILQLFFLYMNKVKWKRNHNDIHIYTAITINLITLICAYYNILANNFLLKYSLITCNLINIGVALYKNIYNCKKCCKH